MLPLFAYWIEVQVSSYIGVPFASLLVSYSDRHPSLLVAKLVISAGCQIWIDQRPRTQGAM